MRFLHSLSEVTLRDRIKSEKIRKQLKVEENIYDIQNYQQNWNQHVLRMLENRLTTQIIAILTTRQKRFGRPYRRWKD